MDNSNSEPWEQAGRFSVIRASDIERRQVEWLWKPFLHRRAVNLITGSPGCGKSTIACDIAARLSRGAPFPGEDEAAAKERGVLKTWLFNAEDDPETTISWRLDNQGADSGKVWITTAGVLSPGTFKDICKFVREKGIDLLVFDPIQAWIDAGVDMYRPNTMRAWGNLSRDLCLETGATVLWVRHRRKGENLNEMDAGLGSIDLSGIARSELSAITSKKTGMHLKRIKGSVGQSDGRVWYEIRPTENDHGRLDWRHQKRDIAAAPDLVDEPDVEGVTFADWRHAFGKGQAARKRASRAKKALENRGFRVVEGVWEGA